MARRGLSTTVVRSGGHGHGHDHHHGEKGHDDHGHHDHHHHDLPEPHVPVPGVLRPLNPLRPEYWLGWTTRIGERKPSDGPPPPFDFKAIAYGLILLTAASYVITSGLRIQEVPGHPDAAKFEQEPKQLKKKSAPEPTPPPPPATKPEEPAQEEEEHGEPAPPVEEAENEASQAEQHHEEEEETKN